MKLAGCQELCGGIEKRVLAEMVLRELPGPGSWGLSGEMDVLKRVFSLQVLHPWIPGSLLFLVHPLHR